jgi:hypothetical protein
MPVLYIGRAVLKVKGLICFTVVALMVVSVQKPQHLAIFRLFISCTFLYSINQQIHVLDTTQFMTRYLLRILAPESHLQRFFQIKGMQA